MFSNKSHQPSITSKVVISKLRRNEFHLPHWFKTKLFHRKRPEMNVRLYTYKPENIKTRQLCFPDSSLCLGLSEGLRASGRCEKWCFSHLFPSSAPWWKLVPKPSPAKAMRTSPEVERRPARLGEGGASLHRKEREHQTKWEAQLPYPWETCQFLKVTEITPGCDALFLICWYKIDN